MSNHLVIVLSALLFCIILTLPAHAGIEFNADYRLEMEALSNDDDSILSSFNSNLLGLSQGKDFQLETNMKVELNYEHTDSIDNSILSGILDGKYFLNDRSLIWVLSLESTQLANIPGETIERYSSQNLTNANSGLHYRSNPNKRSQIKSSVLITNTQYSESNLDSSGRFFNVEYIYSLNRRESFSTSLVLKDTTYDDAYNSLNDNILEKVLLEYSYESSYLIFNCSLSSDIIEYQNINLDANNESLVVNFFYNINSNTNLRVRFREGTFSIDDLNISLIDGAGFIEQAGLVDTTDWMMTYSWSDSKTTLNLSAYINESQNFFDTSIDKEKIEGYILGLEHNFSHKLSSNGNLSFSKIDSINQDKYELNLNLVYALTKRRDFQSSISAGYTIEDVNNDALEGLRAVFNLTIPVL